MAQVDQVVDFGTAQHASALGARIGHIIMYDVPTIDEEIEDIRHHIAAAGLDPATLPRTTPVGALKKALNAVRVHNRENNNVFVRKVSQSPTFKKYQMTLERRKGHKEAVDASLDYLRELEILMHNPNGYKTQQKSRINFDSDRHPEVRELIVNTFNHALTHVDRFQFTWWAHTLIKEINAVPLRTKGGTWFVVEAHTSIVESMAQVMQAVGGRLYFFPVFEAGGGDIMEATEVVVLNDLRRMQEEIEEITQQKKLTDKQLVSRRKKLADKLLRIEVIEDLLKLQSVKVQQAAESVAQAMTAGPDTVKETVETVETTKTVELKPEPYPVVEEPKRVVDTSVDFNVGESTAEDPF